MRVNLARHGVARAPRGKDFSAYGHCTHWLGGAIQPKARILARTGVARRSAAGISRVWQGTDFSQARRCGARRAAARQGNDFSKVLNGSAGTGSARQSDARIFNLRGVNK